MKPTPPDVPWSVIDRIVATVAPRTAARRYAARVAIANLRRGYDAAARGRGTDEHTVGKWRRRFAKERIGGLTDEYRPGRPRTVSDDQVAEVIERTLNTTPKDAPCRPPPT